MSAVELTDGIVTVSGTSTLTYEPDLPADSDAVIYAVATKGGSVTSTTGHITAGGVIGKLSAVAGRYAWTQSTLERVTFGLDLAGSNKYDGATLAPNGKIYSVPRTANQFLIIDTVTGTAVLDDLGCDLTIAGNPSTQEKWGYGGVLGVDGRIYMCPRDAPDILIVDPVAGTATREDYGLDLSASAKWRGGVSAPDGKIYFVPMNATNILIVDVHAQTATLSTMGASLSGSNKWLGGCLAPNGKIYCTPVEATDFLIIDTVAGTASRSNLGATIPGPPTARGWAGAVLGSDGKIYCCPNNNTTIAIIDPVAGTATTSDMGATITTDDKWLGGTVGPDGKIYLAPFVDGLEVLVIDPSTSSARVDDLGLGSLSGEYVGMTQGFDGNLYSMPRSVNDVLRIQSMAPPLPRHLLLGPHLNKY